MSHFKAKIHQIRSLLGWEGKGRKEGRRGRKEEGEGKGGTASSS